MKLTVFNPTKDAIKNLSGLEKIVTGRNWNTTKFCWTCSKDKHAKDGRLTGHRDGKPGFAVGAPVRFTCSDCLQARADRKAAAEVVLNGLT